MEIILCGSLMGAVLFFFYLLNTARKKTPAPTAGKKDYIPVYLSIADDPDAVIEGTDRFVAEVHRIGRRQVGLGAHAHLFCWVRLDGCGWDPAADGIYVPYVHGGWNRVVDRCAGHGAYSA